MTNETLTTPAVRAMIREWLTGDDESDAKRLKRAFRTLRLSIAEWRQVIAETKTIDQ